jgi:hypothetical protein
MKRKSKQPTDDEIEPTEAELKASERYVTRLEKRMKQDIEDLRKELFTDAEEDE